MYVAIYIYIFIRIATPEKIEEPQPCKSHWRIGEPPFGPPLGEIWKPLYETRTGGTIQTSEYSSIVGNYVLN